MDIQFIESTFRPEPESLLSLLGLDPDSDEAGDFLHLLDELAPFARPRAALGEARVTPTAAADRILVGGVEFEGKLLADNLKEEEVAWPYVATCGREIYDRVSLMADPFERYWAEEIMQAALTAAMVAMEEHLTANVFPGKTAAMSPGSLEEWPIGQQIPLFRLLGAGVERCGVTLTESLLMLPNKSVSGIRFHNEHGFVSCRLCPREICPNRRAAYDGAGAAGAGMLGACMH